MRLYGQNQVYRIKMILRTKKEIQKRIVKRVLKKIIKEHRVTKTSKVMD